MTYQDERLRAHEDLPDRESPAGPGATVPETPESRADAATATSGCGSSSDSARSGSVSPSVTDC